MKPTSRKKKSRGFTVSELHDPHPNSAYKTVEAACNEATAASGEKIYPGDCVSVAGPVAGKDFVGKISSFYKNKFTDQTEASISWFYSEHELPRKFHKDLFNTKEVFLAIPLRADSIEIDSILGKCSVNYVDPNHSHPEELQINEYFYSRSFDGRKIEPVNSPCWHSQRSSVENKQTIISKKRFCQAPLRLAETVDDASSMKAVKPVLKQRGLLIKPRKSRSCRTDYGNSVKESNTLAKTNLISPRRQQQKDDVSASISASSFGKFDASSVASLLFDSEDIPVLESGKNAVVKLAPCIGPQQLKHLDMNQYCRGERTKTVKENETENLTLTKEGRVSSIAAKNGDSGEIGHLSLRDSALIVQSPQVKSKKRRKAIGSDNKPITKSKSFVLNRLDEKTSALTLNSPQSISKHQKYKKKSLKTRMESEAKWQKSIEMQPTATPVRKSIRLKSKVINMKEERNSDEESLDSGSESDFIEQDSEAASTDEPDEDDDFNGKVLKPQQKKVFKRKLNYTAPISTTRNKFKSPHKKQLVMPNRKTPIKVASGHIERARERLHVSAVPDCLPCREKEFHEIYTFIEGQMQSGGGGCMYVSGVPGTGKTATVQEVMKSLQNSADCGDLPKFKFIDINGMRLTEPRQAYVQFLLQLQDEKATTDRAADLLSDIFSKRRTVPTVVLADELDLLWTKKQDVLYHLFDWPTHRHAKLIVVAIANTMDLPERIMMNRVSSRLGLTRLTFRPYDYKQLQEIVVARLTGLNTFDSDAIQLVSRKVAAVSGDARRCLDICRRATEIVERKQKKRVTIEHVHEVLQEMFATPMIQALRSCSKQEKLFLQAVVAEFRRSGVEEATLGMINHQHAILCQQEGASPISVSMFVRISQRLASCRLISLEQENRDLFSRVRLNISVDDVLFSLKQ